MTKLVVKKYRYSLLYYDKVCRKEISLLITVLVQSTTIKFVVKKFRYSLLYYDKVYRKEISLLITVLR